ncbi:MAG: hypothetical protein EBS56_12705, partial [Planctomycetia bacterium]|nr:hypothetical protein [Planctomycetia bacterium]
HAGHPVPEGVGVTPIVFGPDRRAVLSGTSLTVRDKQFFTFTPATDAILRVVIRPDDNVRRPDLDVEELAERRTVLELKPHDGDAAAGEVLVRAGRAYYIRVQSPDLDHVHFDVGLQLVG